MMVFLLQLVNFLIIFHAVICSSVYSVARPTDTESITLQLSLRPRNPHDKFGFALEGTNLYATIIFESESLYDLITPFLPLLDRRVDSMQPNDNPAEVTIWPAEDAQGQGLDYYGVFQICRACDDPPLDAQLLQGLRQGLNEYHSQASSRENFDMFYNFWGHISHPDDTNAFVFRSWAVHPQVAQSQKQQGTNIGINNLEDIYNIKQQILDITTPEDLLIFLGNTGSYFYYGFKPSDNRNVQLACYDGDPYKEDSPSDSELDGWKTYVGQPIFNSKSAQGRVIIIDHLQSGNSMQSFVKLLEDTNLKPWREDYLIINLAYWSEPNNEPEVIGFDYLATFPVGEQDSDLQVLKFAFVGRLLPYYSREMWILDPTTLPFPDDRYRDNTIRNIQDHGQVHAGT